MCRSLALMFAFTVTAASAAPLACDANGDGSIDKSDIDLIVAARNTRASGASDVRDVDGDGMITVGDARICALRCTRARCSTTNSAPRADAGANQTVRVTSIVTLDGSKSSDPDGDRLTYAWSFVSVPAGSAAALLNPTTVNPTFTVDRPGDYVIQLTVNDGHLSSVLARVVVSTVNSPPVANAGRNQSVRVSSRVMLDGTGSTDVDGDVLSYSWSFVSRPLGSVSVLDAPLSVRPSFMADRAGTYVVQLVVNDGKASSAPSTVTVTTTNTPPVSSAGPDQTVFVGETVTLNGSASTDADGDALTWVWALISRPPSSTAALSDPNAVNPKLVVDRPGTYVAQLVVNDGFAVSAPDTVVINTRNSAPKADAGASQVAAVGATVTLDGSASSDVDGDPLTFAWSFLSRPTGSAARLTSATAVRSSFVIDRPGTYVLQLIVNDGLLNSAPATTTVSTSNTPPVANAGPDQSTTVGATVMLDGSASSDAEGSPLTFAWALTAVPPGSTATLNSRSAVKPTFVADRTGTYVAQLTVNDGTLTSAPSTVTISTVNSRPVARAGAAQTVDVGSTVHLDGAASSDADGDPLVFRWTFTSTPPGSAAVLNGASSVTPTFVADRPGLYVVQLIVNDGHVDSAPASTTITANAVNRPPVANAGPNQTASVGSVVTLDGSGSSDPDGDPLTYLWTATVKPSGSTASLSSATSVKPTFVPDRIGTYVFSLVVNDGKVASTAVSVSITVVTSNRAPVANAGVDQNVAVGATVTLDGSRSSDPDGDALTFSWTMVSRPAGSTAALSSTTASKPTFVADVAGRYSFSLTVSDGRLSSAASTVAVNAAASDTVSMVVGPSGATVSMPDGTHLDIPSGALAAATTIRITASSPPAGATVPPTGVFVAKVYTFEPAGLVFRVPANLTVAYNPAAIPAGYDPSAVLTVGSDDGVEYHIAKGAQQAAEDAESPLQTLNAANRTISVLIDGFSSYSAIAVNSSAAFVDTAETLPTASIHVRVPTTGGTRTTKPGPGQSSNSCPVQVSLPVRTAAQIAKIVIHSTNGAVSTSTWNGTLGWATDKCALAFAHYYIDKTGEIYRVADDDKVVLHIGNPTMNGLDNATTLGIELFNNVGEPYDGRQIGALIRLVDFLMEKYALPRQQRDPATGLYDRSAANRRLFMHNDYNGKCDPIGFMRSLNMVFGINNTQGCATPATPIAGVTAVQPALIDAIFDALSVMRRNAQHTGVVNASGGDSMGTERGGAGGAVRIRQDAAAVAGVLGSAVPLLTTENALLVVAPGTTTALSGTQTFSDAMILGTLQVSGSVDLRVKGTVYLAPNGKIIARNGTNGGNVTIYSRNAPILQGLIDARGEDAVITPSSPGGAGGNVTIYYDAPNSMLLLPTIITRGGDTDAADVLILVPDSGKGGNGGDVRIESDSVHVMLGGGVGLRGSVPDTPPIRSGTIDPSLPPPPTFVGDALPPPPPFNLSSIGSGRPVADQRIPLRKASAQTAFTRGFLTTGGIGGWGGGGIGQNGGPGGDGGDITLQNTARTVVTMRDIDFVSGADVETITFRFFLPETGTIEHLVCPITGSLGGMGTGTGGTRGGDGGPGGAAGTISLLLGTLNPAATAITSPYEIKAFVPGLRLSILDDFCSPGSQTIGFTKQVTGSDGSKLYRLRVDSSGSAVGGVGGIPGGRPLAGQFPGRVGAIGTSAPITGFPLH